MMLSHGEYIVNLCKVESQSPQPITYAYALRSIQVTQPTHCQTF